MTFVCSQFSDQFHLPLVGQQIETPLIYSKPYPYTYISKYLSKTGCHYTKGLFPGPVFMAGPPSSKLPKWEHNMPVLVCRWEVTHLTALSLYTTQTGVASFKYNFFKLERKWKEKVCTINHPMKKGLLYVELETRHLFVRSKMFNPIVKRFAWIWFCKRLNCSVQNTVLLKAPLEHMGMYNYIYIQKMALVFWWLIWDFCRDVGSEHGHSARKHPYLCSTAIAESPSCWAAIKVATD